MNISIALATYNGERWLREQLDSLARQTLLPCELVISDDQSSDDTLVVIREFVGHVSVSRSRCPKWHTTGLRRQFHECAEALRRRRSGFL